MVTRNYPPLVGGMERLIRHAVIQLEKCYKCDVVGPSGCHTIQLKDGKSYSCRLKPFIWFFMSAIWWSLFSTLRNRYGLYIAGSGVTAPIVVILAKLFNAPSVVFLHGLDLVIDHRFYQALFIPFIRRADRVVVNSHYTASLARKRGLCSNQIKVIFPGVEFTDSQIDPKPFLDTYGLRDKKILLSVGRLIPRKGLIEFIDHCLPTIVQNNPDITLLIIGHEPRNALVGTHNIMHQIQTKVAEHDLKGHVVILGEVDDATLHAAFSAANLLVMPIHSVPGDVEGFGIVAIEAAVNGVPTVAFALGGVTDAVKDRVSGYLIGENDYESFVLAVEDILRGSYINPEGCIAFAKRFNWGRFGDELRNLCSDAMLIKT